MKLFDTHAHLLDARFDPDRDALIAAFPSVGVRHMTEAATCLSDLPRVAALCHAHPGVLVGAAGVHPESAEEWSPAAADALEAALADPVFRAVGEIGLDYHYDDAAPRAVQKACFSDQLAIARAHGLPVLIHDRDAHGDCMDLLRAHRDGLAGVMHCFSGSYETACECLSLGLYVAFGGSLTFKNAARLREIAKKLPADRIVVETDCPYMTPEPFRGTRNEPAHTAETMRVLAAVRGEDPETLSEALYRNSLALFGLNEESQRGQ